jgi:flagellar motor switch/type III secretory pathway protein FliN
MMKPYRLINATEIQELHQHFSEVLEQWNEEYSVVPFRLELKAIPKNFSTTNTLMIQEYDNDLGLIDDHYLSTINHALFAEDKPCFNTASQKLLLRLLNSFFKTEECHEAQSIQEAPDWFYAGSTCLLLTLSCGQEYLTLILSPHWVYQQLPEPHVVKNQLDSLSDALAEHKVNLYLELTPSPLSVKNLAGIQVGDVLSTNHLLTAPLKLTRGKELIAHAELGHSSHHKSIVIKRSS